MTNYEIRVTQTCRDYYRVEAVNSKEAEQQVWAALRSGKLGKDDCNVKLDDTIDSPPQIDYTVQLSPEGEVIL